MFRLLQIDPETLAIHINASVIARHKKADTMFAFLNSATRDGPLGALRSASSRGADLDILDFGSSFMHELRHFGDLLLTPFGFYRIRTAFEFYMQFPKLFFADGQQVPIPLMSGMDPVTRFVIGMADGFEGAVAHQLGRTSLSRVKLINFENKFDTSTGEVRIGGDRILEGLAYTSQFELLFNDYNTPRVRDHFNNFFSGYTGTAFDHAYRWFIPFVHSLHPNEKLPNNRLMQAILFASLCGSIPVKAGVRIGGIQPKDLPTRDVSKELPSSRYHKLIEYFSKVPRPSLEYDEEAAYIVNYACEVLFGKGLIGEIEEDMAHTDYIANRYMEWAADLPYEARRFNMVPAFSILKDYRRQIFKYFREDVTLFTSPTSFMGVTANLLQPSLIYNVPQGVEGGDKPGIPLGKTVGLIDRHSIFAEEEGGLDTRTIYSFWSPRSGDLSHGVGIDEADIDTTDGAFKDATLSSLQTLYGIFAPLYRWLLFGNRYLTMSEFENYQILDALKLPRDRFVIDEFYSKSEDISTATAFFRFFGENQMKCDVCYSDVGEQDSFVVSARTVRQNTALNEHFKQQSPDNYRYLFERDWSDWLCCTDCMNKWSFPIPTLIAASRE